MRKIFVIGGMGAGKSTAVEALREQGLFVIDMDEVTHQVLTWAPIKESLVVSFGPDIVQFLGRIMVIRRDVLAQKAFADQESVDMLNSIMVPNIKALFLEYAQNLEQHGTEQIGVEVSVFTTREDSFVQEGDLVLAIAAPVEERVARAVAAGWDEEDVRKRISFQPTDEDRAAQADVVIENNGSIEDLKQAVKAWYDALEI